MVGDLYISFYQFGLVRQSTGDLVGYSTSACEFSSIVVNLIWIIFIFNLKDDFSSLRSENWLEIRNLCIDDSYLNRMFASKNPAKFVYRYMMAFLHHIYFIYKECWLIWYFKNE